MIVRQHLADDPTYRAALAGRAGRPAALVGRVIDVNLSTAAFPLDASPGRHLAIFGSQPTGADVLEAAARSVAAFHAPRTARFVICSMVAEGDEPAKDLAAEIGHRQEVVVVDAAGLAAELDLERPGYRIVFGMDAEFANRPDGLKPLLETYDMHFKRSQMKQMDPGLVYTALHNNQLKIGLVYTTDGRVKGFGIVPLEDDKHFFPPYNATPVVRKEALEHNPKLAAQLNALSAALNNDVMQDMNKAVDLDGKSPREVADAFLRTHQLP